MEYVNEKMGMAVGRLFIRENFRQHSKEMVRTMQSKSTHERFKAAEDIVKRIVFAFGQWKSFA